MTVPTLEEVRAMPTYKCWCDDKGLHIQHLPNMQEGVTPDWKLEIPREHVKAIIDFTTEAAKKWDGAK